MNSPCHVIAAQLARFRCYAQFQAYQNLSICPITYVPPPQKKGGGANDISTDTYALRHRCVFRRYLTRSELGGSGGTDAQAALGV